MTALQATADPSDVPAVVADPHRLRRRVLLTLTFVGLILLMLRPSWHSLTTKVPDLGDPVLYGWSWNWTRHALFTDPGRLFDGNIFWRHHLTVAYTDNMLVLLAPFSLLRAAGAGWASQLNALSLGMAFGSLAATFSLARRITGRTDASIFAAIAYTFGAFTFAHVGHLQLLLLGQFPLGFLLMFRWFERRRAWDAVWLGLLNASFFLGALYYAAIWMVCVAVVLIGYLVMTRFRPGPRFARGLVIVAVCSATAIPFVVPYVELGQRRPLIPEWGLQPRDLLNVAPGSFLYPGIDSWANASVDRGEHTFFPGFSTELLAAVGLGALLWPRRMARRRARIELSSDRRRELWLMILAGSAAVVLSLGPEVRGHTLPFTWFHNHVPGFAGIRVAARLAVPGLLVGAILAAVGIAAIVRRVPARTARVIVFGLCGFLLLELAAPLTHVTLPDDARTLAVYRELARKPAGAVVELPIANPAVGGEWARIEAPRMLYSTLDFHPRINGYSGTSPTDYLGRRTRFNQFPAPISLRAARNLGVRYVVLHAGVYAGLLQYTDAQIRAIVARLPSGATAHRYGNAWLVEVGRP